MPFRPKKSIEARRVGASLVTGFHKANPPLIWRFDLSRHHSFSLLLRKEAGHWVLGLAPAENEFHVIAHFLSQADAEEAFAAIEKILARRATAWLGTALKFLGVSIALVVVAILLFIGVTAAINMIHAAKTTPAANQAYSTGVHVAPPAVVPDIKPGVPLPADDYLKPPP